jgi:hypothetical protein
VSEENIISEDHAHRIQADKISTDNKSLGQSVGAGLDSICELHAKLMSVPE